MTQILYSGQTISLVIPSGQRIVISTEAGSYSASLTTGANKGLVLASNSMLGATFGPYVEHEVVFLSAGEGAIVSFEVGVSPELDHHPVSRYVFDVNGNVNGFLAPDGSVYNPTDNTLTLLTADTGASLIGFKQSGTGAVSRTIDEKNKDSITDKDYGVIGDGATDDTAKLSAALEYCVENNKTLILTSKTYKVSGNILANTVRAGARTLSIHCAVPVTITYDPAAAGVPYFIYLWSSAEANTFITGCPLTFDGSSKVATFMRCNNNGAENTGVVDIQAKVTCKNLKNTDAASTIENGGMLFIGNYGRVAINEPEISLVERTNAAGGACCGIAVSEFTGVVDIYSPKISNVLTPSATDADGIKVFGKLISANRRAGVATIHGGVYTDNQGRHIKSQCSQTRIINPVSIRKFVVTIPSGADFDFQSGNGLLLNPRYTYKKNSGTSPLGSSHSPVIFQQIIEDENMIAESIGGEMVTEVAMLRYCAVTHTAASHESISRVSGLKVSPITGFTTTVFTNALLYSRADTIEAKSARTFLEVSDCKAPMTLYWIGYDSYGGSSLTSKLNISVFDNESTLTTPLRQPFYKLGGTTIRSVEKFLFKNNQNTRSLYADFDFTVNQMQVGSVISVDLSTCVVTGMPSWTATGYATFHCIDQYVGNTDKSVWAIKASATSANTMYWTQDGGTTWGQIK